MNDWTEVEIPICTSLCVPAVRMVVATGSAWLASPAHAASLLNPAATRVGLAGTGTVWTFEAY